MLDLNTILANLTDATARSDVAGFEQCAADFEAIGTPEAQVRALTTRAQIAMMHGEPARALELNHQAQHMAEQHGLTLLAVKAMAGAGNAHRSLGELDRALELHRRTLAIHEDLASEVGLATSHHNIGLVLYDIGRLADAVPHLRQAIEYHERGGNAASLARVTGLLGCVFADSGATAEGLELLFKALEQHEQIGDHRGMMQALNNIGTIYFEMERDDDALEYYQRTLALLESAAFHGDTAQVYSNLGSTLVHLGRTDEAIPHLEKAVEMHITSGDTVGLSSARNHLAMLWFRNGELDRAQDYVDRYAESATGSVFAQLPWLSLKADLLIAKGDMDAANAMMQRYLEIAESSGFQARIATAHEMLRDLALKRNDLQAYVFHNTEATRIAEEISGRAVTQRMTILEADRRFERERQERDKERALLYGALPKAVADRMIRGEKVTGDHFDHAAVLFIDVAEFTTHTAAMHPSDVVQLLEDLFSRMDSICERHSAVKIKTIGDSYMCFRGDGTEAENALSIARVALDVARTPFTWPDNSPLTVRMGAHIGPATAGVIGTQRLQYDVWGDTVNVASRMESHGEPGRVHVSEAFAAALRSENGEQRTENDPSPHPPIPLSLHPRGVIDIKGKGPMTTYWLERA